MAATMHAKIHRRKLDKLNIIKICEEILNPSVPMALRLSGILMGKSFQLIVEINEACKVKSDPSDPTRLPKGKSQANYHRESVPYSKGTVMMDFQQTSYIAMRLDTVDDTYLNPNLEGDLNHDHHQADADNITLVDNYDSFRADTATFNRFERFDIEGDDGTQMNYTPPEQTEMPSLISSPPRQDEHQKSDEIQEQHPEEQVKQQSNEAEEAKLHNNVLTLVETKTPAALAMEYEQNIIPGHIYQSWLQDTSDIMSKRRGKRKPKDAWSVLKIATKMELPSVVLMEKLIAIGNGRIEYPAPFLDMWKKCTRLPHNSPSVRSAERQPQEPSSSSPPERMHFMEPMGELRNNLRNNGLGSKEVNGVSDSKTNLMATPGNSDDEIRSIPSSGSGHGFFSHNSEVNAGLSGKKRPYSASKNSGNGLEPVAEELSWQHSDPSFKLAKLSKKGPTPDHDLMVETGPTQTQKRPVTNQPLDPITDSIRM
ncbi:hypothetical protein ABFS83_11G101800 [Erythranthe nasuta]